MVFLTCMHLVLFLALPLAPGNSLVLSAKAREYVFTGVALCVCLCVCLSVCLSVTTITKTIVGGFVPNFMGRFLEREDQVRVSLRSVEGCGSNGQILQMAHCIS